MSRGTFNVSRRGTWSRGGDQHQGGRPYERKELSAYQLMKGLGSDIDSIPVPSDAGQSSPISIQTLEAVASYSWLNASNPTIAIPGAPPIWRGRRLPYIVPRDTGTVFTDQNAARLSTSPLFPLIVAVSQYAPEFSLPSVDFITDRNGLRKLYRWASSDSKAGTFRIDVDLVGRKTVLMQRCEAENVQQGGPGYEIGFEKASTAPQVGCENATGHHRIVSYDLGGLKMLVRFKSDACLPRKTSTNSGLKGQTAQTDQLDELTAGLQKLTVTDTTTLVPTFNGTSLTIHTRGGSGTLVPQSDLLELKTRSTMSVDQFDWDDTYSQLMLSQTPNVFLCVHQRGEFREVRERKLSELETEPMARKAQGNLRRLRKVLGALQTMMTEEGKGVRASLICKPGAELGVYEREGKDTCLPKEILKLFN